MNSCSSVTTGSFPVLGETFFWGVLVRGGSLLQMKCGLNLYNYFGNFEYHDPVFPFVSTSLDGLTAF